MSVITLGTPRPMADGDSNLAWIELGSLAVAVISGAIGFVSRGFTRAAREGESVGELRLWRASVDTQQKSMSTQLDALETRQRAQFDAADARREIVNTRLAGVPTRDEMQNGMARMRDEMHADMMRIETKIDRVLQRDQRD